MGCVIVGVCLNRAVWVVSLLVSLYDNVGCVIVGVCIWQYVLCHCWCLPLYVIVVCVIVGACLHSCDRLIPNYVRW